MITLSGTYCSDSQLRFQGTLGTLGTQGTLGTLGTLGFRGHPSGNPQNLKSLNLYLCFHPCL